MYKNDNLFDKNILFSILDDLGHDMAHELRTPMAAMKSGASGIKKHLQLLINFYQKAVKDGVISPEISPRNLENLKNALDFIETAGNRASWYINSLVTNLTCYQQVVNHQEKKPFLVIALLQSILSSYPYKIPEQRLMCSVNNDSVDFNCIENLEIVKNIFLNIIIYFLDSKNRNIIVFTEISEKENRLYFKDVNYKLETGSVDCSISTHDMIKFRLFFCKELIKKINGEFFLKFENGKCLEIDIRFPFFK